MYENIALPLVLNHVPKDQIKKKVQEVLEYVELTDKKDVYPSKLSGGQKQRVGTVSYTHLVKLMLLILVFVGMEMNG